MVCSRTESKATQSVTETASAFCLSAHLLKLRCHLLVHGQVASVWVTEHQLQSPCLTHVRGRVCCTQAKANQIKKRKIPDRFQRRRLTIEEDSMRSRSGGRGERKESGVQHIHAQRLTRAKACPRPKCCCINGYKKQPEATQRHKKTLWHPPCLHCRHHQLHQTSESKARVRSVQCRLLVRKESEKKGKKKKKKLLTGDNGQLNMHR